MREILFRGKTKDRWVYGSLPVIVTTSNVDDVYPETIGQYTGLTDKNGKKIFEGDIMTFAAYGYTYVGVVKYVGSSFSVECKNATPFLDDAIAKYDAAIIGNIHDNNGE